MAEITPMLQQYLGLKEQHPQALLFFRLGDFYELFNDDALIASRELDIVLTGRDAGRDLRMPMCGVPYHAATQYIGKLLSRGYRVALCEQVEDPKTAKGLVAREVVRVFTPGTVVEEGLLPAGANNFLAAVAAHGRSYGLAAADLSTGEFFAAEAADWQSIADELARLAPAELLVPEDLSLPDFTGVMTVEAGHFLEPSQAAATLAAHYELAKPDALGFADSPAATRAAGAVLSYLRQTQRGEVKHVQWPRRYQFDEYMYLDANTRRNLELTRTYRDGRTDGTLLWVLDHTVTSMGARTLRSWLEAPLARLAPIDQRHQAVAELAVDLGLRADLTDLLCKAGDLPRLVARLSCTGGNGRDLLGLGRTLSLLPELASICGRMKAALLVKIGRSLAPLPDLAAKLCAAVATDAPATVKEGGIFNPGYHAGLDELRAAAREGRDWVAALEARERERTGIRSLKVGFNQVFGYYIEITKANLASAPADYVRRQTLANAERFVNEELKEYERKILGADERARALEYELFQEIRGEVITATGRLQEIGRAMGELDALLSLATVAVKYNYVRPRMTETGRLHLRAARHPVVERCLPGGDFVPNDTDLEPDGVRIQVITGPNMSGKSTYLRQTALLVLLAHMGSFVPAAEADVGLVDRIFTRIGAADDLAGGRSTFLVEMTETAEILRAATGRSLLILDEIGRGTGTIDGQAIARAVLEYLHDQVKAKSLFATHYHELAETTAGRPGIAHFNVAVIREGDEITFCHLLRPGAADRSYGIEVARLAGLPPAVLARARVLQLELEGQSTPPAGESRAEVVPIKQRALFPDDQGIIEELLRTDLADLTPLAAINLLAVWQERLAGKKRPHTSRNRSRGRLQ